MPFLILVFSYSFSMSSTSFKERQIYIFQDAIRTVKYLSEIPLLPLSMVMAVKLGLINPQSIYYFLDVQKYVSRDRIEYNKKCWKKNSKEIPGGKHEIKIFYTTIKVKRFSVCTNGTHKVFAATELGMTEIPYFRANRDNNAFGRTIPIRHKRDIKIVSEEEFVKIYKFFKIINTKNGN